jgi:hypothetical protein
MESLMRTSTVFQAAIAILSCFSTPLSAQQPLPTVVVDTEHSQFGKPEGEEAPPYVVRPAEAVILDARGLDLSKTLYPGVAPNAVQLLLGNDRQYWAPWSTSSVIELSAKTLLPLNESSPFSGLKAGDSAILAIGVQRVEEKDGEKEIVLKLLWGAMLEVGSK